MSELKDELLKRFRNQFNNDDYAIQLYGKLQQQSASHKDALAFAKRVGEIATNAFKNSTSGKMFPAGDAEKEMIESIIGLLRVDHQIVTEATSIVQKNINEKANLGLKPVEPKIDLERAEGLAQNVAEQESYEKATARMHTGLDNFSQHTVDEHLRQNARFHWKTGMNPKIVRKADSGACKWCRALAGTYDYEDVKDTGNDVFRRHENCDCTVEFIVGKKAQDVWSKATYRRDDRKDRVNSIKRIEETRARQVEELRNARVTRTKAIEKIQKELGYSSKEATILFNRNTHYIAQNGIENVIEYIKHISPIDHQLLLHSVDYSKYNHNEDGSIRPTKTVYHKAPSTSDPFDVIDIIQKDGTINRTLYNEIGEQHIRIHPSDHNRPDKHPIGGHKHYVEIGPNGEKMHSNPIPLSDEDRKENSNIL